ncbi:MAG: hypothetical protein KJ063_22300 [Anaerolineae bacterium]|nr:hypothetical protein [Anaerolineae bacterium]
MTAMTVEVSPELAQRLQPLYDRLPNILELGLREWQATNQHGFEGAAEVLELLAVY